MSTNCEYYEMLMSQMLDRELLDAEAQALRDHVRTCSHCRALCAAFSSMALSLRDDVDQPPASLKPDVMARIRAFEQSKDSPEHETAVPEPIFPARHPAKRPARQWPKYAAAACLLVVIGSGAIAAMRSGASVGLNAAADTVTGAARYAAAESAEASVYTAESAEGAESAQSYSLDEADANTDDSLLMQSALTDEAAAEYALPAPDLSAYTRDAPAAVPAGKEADFEALLDDVGRNDSEVTADARTVICAVEYRGVIYEFLTDEPEEQALFWQDAAEGYPTRSSGSVSDLYAVFE